MSGRGTVDARTGAGLVGVGAVACAACCAGPVAGFVAGVGLSAAIGGVLFGVVGLLVVAATAGGLWRRRQRRRCPTPERAPSEPVVVEAPRLRSRS